jgi:hypothetical protein
MQPRMMFPDRLLEQSSDLQGIRQRMIKDVAIIGGGGGSRLVLRMRWREIKKLVLEIDGE